MSKKEIIIRAVKTFAQAFLPIFVAAISTTEKLEISELKAMLASAAISAAAAGISAVWNSAIKKMNEKEGVFEKNTFG